MEKEGWWDRGAEGKILVKETKKREGYTVRMNL